MKEVNNPPEVKLILGEDFPKSNETHSGEVKIKPGSTQERHWGTNDKNGKMNSGFKPRSFLTDMQSYPRKNRKK